MPDETGTETTRPDTPVADGSLFGDAEDYGAAAIADEEDSGEETAQEASDDAEEQAGQLEDLKVVVSIKGGRVTIGVQRTSCDPHIESFDDQDPSGLAWRVSEVLERARAKWEDEPKHPTHERPAPPDGRQNRRGQGSARASRSEAEGDQQQPHTLSLF